MNKNSKTGICLLLALLSIGIGQMHAQKDKGFPKIASPGLYPVILGASEFELNFFYNVQRFPEVYRQDAPYNLTNFEQRTQQGQMQLTFGLSDGSNVNLGIDLGYSYIETSLKNTRQNPFEIGPHANLGPRVRWEPFPKLFSKSSSLFLQHKLLISLVESKVKFVDTLSIVNQMVFSQRLGYSFLLQAEVGAIFSPAVSIAGRTSSKRPITTPASLYLGFIATSRWVLYGSLNYIPEFSEVPWFEDGNRYRRRAGTHAGGGIQFIFSQRLSFFASYQGILDAEFGGAANSLTFSVRFSNQ